ncbi:triple tyrosine motif-containing protein [Aquimarina addita]|uniref:Triple tyrosine motif-containing protein n=1 Tax=Aquimarina addita TaxID=870485 RepID=A0ABP6UK63_9FLAO
MKSLKETFLFLLYIGSLIVSSQELPPIEAYLPEAYGGETQNWSISQSDNKYIYVANNKGLLEFNGATWELYETPNKTIIRSVNVVGDRIYTGCYMDFGFWKKNEYGKLEYTSLSNPIKDSLIEDEQFWYILDVGNRVLFQSLHRIYIYNSDTGEINNISAELAMLSMFDVNGVVYYQEYQKGIFKIEKGEPKLVTDLSILDNDKVVHISDSSEGLIILTSANGFFIYKDDKIKPWEIMKLDFFQKATIYSAIRLQDKSFLLGTISKGVIHISEEGVILSQINQSNGLSNNTILSLFEDNEENIWLALDNGINCVNLKSPIKIFNDDRGSIGATYAAAVLGDFLYLGTNQGLFYKNRNTNEAFQFIEGTNGQVWSLFVHDDLLFCGHNSGTFLIDNSNVSKLISPIAGTWEFATVPGYPELLIQGTYNGLSLLEKKDNNWQFKHSIKGFRYSARFLELYEDELWINHEYKGVFRLKLDGDFTTVKQVIRDSSLSKGKNSGIIKYKEALLYANEQGIFTYNKENKEFSKDTVLSKAFAKDQYISGKLITDNSGKLWSFSKEDINYISQSQFSDDLKITKIPIPSSLRKQMIGYENIMHLQEEEYLLGTANGYMILDLSMIDLGTHDIVLNSVSIKEKHTDFEKISLSEQNPVFDAGLNTILFTYNIPEYDKYLISKFQYKLEGFYDDWSEWSTKTSIIFENLPFGEYTFKVRTKTGNQLSDHMVVYNFVIDRPWYLSVMAIIIYIILLIIAITFTHRAYKRYYTRQKQKLVEDNKKQLELKELESEREIMRLNNEKLLQDIESKNRELASSTMSIIKKNEILNTIKKEIEKSTQEKGGLKNVERIIDKNLNNKDDWKHFEEAFNSVDKDFLKKIKTKHTDLTPHDLRFCTYLRLNLSSKEIAPLLNISVRSVEIKRYRLRKKLKLEHVQSLVNYILEI